MAILYHASINVRKMMMLYELFLFGLLSGVTTWLFGFGGGFVAVPLLYTVIIQKWSNESNIGIHAMQIAVATSAFVMLCSASFAVFRHCRSGHIDWQKSAFVGWYCIWWNCRCGNGLIV